MPGASSSSPPDLSTAAPAHLNEFQDQISLLLASLHEHQRLPVQWLCDSDYRTELLRYRDETERAANTWTRRCRNERFTRYWQAMLDRKLRRQTLVIYISRAIDAEPTPLQSAGARQEYYELLLGQLRSEFRQLHEMLLGIFPHGRITPMKDADHFKHYATFLNPSFAERFDYDPLESFEPALTIHENCWHGEAVGLSDTGFDLDDYHHGLLVLSRWPKVSFPGIIHRLTNLPLLDYTITVNVDPLSVRREIAREEKAHDRLSGDYASEKKLSLVTAMEKKQRKIAALMQGHTLPFNVRFVVRAWDRTKDGLAAKLGAIKNAIHGMNGAQYFECALPTTSKHVFFQTWPGWTWSRYEHRKLNGENRYVADLLPINATFTGHLATAEAIYDGPVRTLIGVKTFSRTGEDATPQHAVLLGMSGAGKSVTVCDLLSQTEGYFDYTVIIEEGLSYGLYTQTVEPDARPIIIQPDGDLTINYLDTHQLPLTPDHLATATALVARMMGLSADEDRQTHRQAQIAKYLNLLFDDVFTEWRRTRGEEMQRIARHACALTRFRRERLHSGATSLEAFVDFRDWRKEKPDEAEAYLEDIEEAEVLRFSKEPATLRELRNLAFAYFTSGEYPTHRMLQELMQLDGGSDDVRELAERLLPWCAGGNYGRRSHRSIHHSRLTRSFGGSAPRASYAGTFTGATRQESARASSARWEARMSVAENAVASRAVSASSDSDSFSSSAGLIRSASRPLRFGIWVGANCPIVRSSILSRNDDVILQPLHYFHIPDPEDRLSIPPAFVLRPTRVAPRRMVLKAPRSPARRTLNAAQF